MSDEFLPIDPEEIKDNPFRLIGKDWMLITSGTPDRFNTMTASWGGLCFMWERQVAMCMVRPTRFTYEFMESSDIYTLSFFTEDHRKALKFCGSNSGRDTDKIKETGLTPLFGDGSVYFNEARLVMICRKIFSQDVDSSRLIDKEIEGFYPSKDYHRLYFGEIEECLVRK